MPLCGTWGGRETLRMSAPVGALMRRAIKDTSLIGHYIPAGTYLVLGIYSTQRMEPWWRDPDTFDPEERLEVVAPDGATSA